MNRQTNQARSECKWKSEPLSEAVANIKLDFRRRADWEQYMLLTSDRHLDNPKSNWKMQKRHLDLAKERNAPVIDCGDLFCAMQGKYDPRSKKTDIREENRKDDYLDTLVDTAEKFFMPYKDILGVIGTGNHETAILKRLETNLTARLIKRLHTAGSNVVAGGYRGWIRLLFSDNGKSQSFNIYYSHGSNSNAPVTKGIIKTNRHAVWLPDADIILTGHIHESWAFRITRARLSQMGKEYVDSQTHIQLPTYKEEFLGSNMGFHHENGRPPKPLGAWWLRFYYCLDQERIKYEAIQAV